MAPVTQTCQALPNLRLESGAVYARKRSMSVTAAEIAVAHIEKMRDAFRAQAAKNAMRRGSENSFFSSLTKFREQVGPFPSDSCKSLDTVGISELTYVETSDLDRILLPFPQKIARRKSLAQKSSLFAALQPLNRAETKTQQPDIILNRVVTVNDLRKLAQKLSSMMREVFKRKEALEWMTENELDTALQRFKKIYAVVRNINNAVAGNEQQNELQAENFTPKIASLHLKTVIMSLSGQISDLNDRLVRTAEERTEFSSVQETVLKECEQQIDDAVSMMFLASAVVPCDALYTLNKVKEMFAIVISKKLGIANNKIAEELFDWRLVQLFQKFDVQKNGEISIKDMANAFEDLGITISDRDMAMIFNSADVDRNGFVSFNEFKGFTTMILAAHKIRVIPNSLTCILIEHSRENREYIDMPSDECSAKDFISPRRHPLRSLRSLPTRRLSPTRTSASSAGTSSPRGPFPTRKASPTRRTSPNRKVSPRRRVSPSRWGSPTKVAAVNLGKDYSSSRGQSPVRKFKGYTDQGSSSFGGRSPLKSVLGYSHLQRKTSAFQRTIVDSEKVVDETFACTKTGCD